MRVIDLLQLLADTQNDGIYFEGPELQPIAHFELPSLTNSHDYYCKAADKAAEAVGL